MVRSIPRALLGLIFVIALMLAAPVAASDDAIRATPVIALQADGAAQERNQYAGTDGASPLDEVPMVPMVAGTVGILGVLAVVAFRREWV
jgi:hypothetical protein